MMKIMENWKFLWIKSFIPEWLNKVAKRRYKVMNKNDEVLGIYKFL